jgi:quinolinate synthase
MRDAFRELPKRRRFEDTAHIANKAPKSPTMRVLSHPTCKNTIAGAWSRPIRGIKQFQVMQKMKSLKGPLRTLTVTEFGHISERAKRAHFTSLRNKLCSWKKQKVYSFPRN